MPDPADPTKPLDPNSLAPPPVPGEHQLYAEFEPQRAYILKEQEFLWQFHSEYGKKTWTWGFDGTTPGPTFLARYGEPVLVRRVNDLEPLWVSHVPFALPSTTTHNHNAHSASESDGEPSDWIGTGDFWDHHYPNFPASIPNPAHIPNSDDPSIPPERIYPDAEKLSTLWYHDHRMDFTAANVYAGLVGFYLLFDEIAVKEADGERRLAKPPQDVGAETEAELREMAERALGNPLNAADEAALAKAWRLPSGDYDVPLLLHDLLFDEDHQLVFDGWNTHGVLGDRFTVNRVIQPHFEVERRKYRFRILNGGPSRFYQVYLHVGEHTEKAPCGEAGHHGAGHEGHARGQGISVGQYDEVENSSADRDLRFIIFSGDGNLLPEPVEADSIVLGVAQRADVIIDFSNFCDGDVLYLENRLDQHHGMGPSGRMIADPDEIRRHRLIQFRVRGEKVDDPSRIPAFFREYAPVDPTTAGDRRRVWQFDYDGGIFTINGLPMAPDRIDAVIKQDTPEMWTFRNNGIAWWHPIHSHLMEWIVLEVNGVPVLPTMVQISATVKGAQDFQKVFQDDYSVPPAEPYQSGRHVLNGPFCGGLRRDIANLGPRTEITMLSRWPDFLGKYILHCHNVVHEDCAMMIRWDVVRADYKPGGKPTEFSTEPVSVADLYPGTQMLPPHIEVRPAHATHAHVSRTFNPKTKRPGHEPSGPCTEGGSSGPHGEHY